MPALVGELKGCIDNEAEGEARQRVLSGTDSDASLADEIKNTGSEFIAITNTTEGISTIGRITNFFRNAMGYQPVEPKT